MLLVLIPILAVFGVGMGLSAAFFALILPLFLLFGLVALVSSVVLGLTTDFVVPTMLVENRGIIAGWRRVWPTLRAEWKQVGLYLLAKFVLAIAVSLAVSIIVLIAAVVLAIPLVIVGAILFFIASAAGIHSAGWVVFLLFAALFFLALFVTSLLVQVPALTFIRYYSLSVLGILDSDLDLVGVDRADESDEDDGEGADDGTGDDDDDDGPADESEENDADEPLTTSEVDDGPATTDDSS